MAFRVLGKEKNLRWDIPVCHSGAVCDKLIPAMGSEATSVTSKTQSRDVLHGICLPSTLVQALCKQRRPHRLHPVPQSEHQMARKTLCDGSLPCAGPWGARGTKEKLPKLNKATITDTTAVQGKLKAKLPVLMSQPRGIVQMGDLSPPYP